MSNVSEPSDDGSVFDEAIDAAAQAFQAVIGHHFGRTFDCSPADELRLLNEYRASSEHLRGGAVMHLRTGLIDADFMCWHSDLADENFGEDAGVGDPMSNSSEGVSFPYGTDIRLIGSDGVETDLTCRLRPTITQFLLARIAEDEAVVSALDCECGDAASTPDPLPSCPARVLAECAAKRAIVELHVEAVRYVSIGRPEVESLGCETCAGYDGPLTYPCPTLRHLATPYAEHPDYDA